MNPQPVNWELAGARPSGRCTSLANWIFAAILFTAFTAEVEAASRPSAISLGTRFFTCTITAATGHCELLDKQTHVTLGATEPDSPFGMVTVRVAGKNSRLPLGRCELEMAGQDAGLVATFHPIGENPTAAVRVRLENLRDHHTIQN